MDPVIHSQIKSPLFRTLQSIPTNSSNYIHGIPDNTPPFSKTSVKVENTGDRDSLTGLQVFKIPQLGHLNRVYLRYRMVGHLAVTGATLATDGDTPLSFASGIEYIQLRSHNNVIQTIPASVIPFESASVSRGEQELKTVLTSLCGYRGAENGITSVNETSEPLMNKPVFVYGQSGFGSQSEILMKNAEAVIRDYIILIPLSSTFYLKDNLQTRMMEDLELVVKTRVSPIQHEILTARPGVETFITDRHDIKATFEFLNFHENVEEVIRNENFKPDIPAALLQSDYVSFSAKYKKKESASLTVENAYFESDLHTDALASDIFIVPRVSANGAYTQLTPLRNVGIEFELESGGESIIKAYKSEIDGIEAMPYSTVTRQYQNSGVLPLRWSSSGTRIRLGLNNTDEHFDGGISFQSLVDPKLKIRVFYSKTDTPLVPTDSDGITNSTSLDTAIANGLVSFDVVLKRKVMLRIDGNTGKIAKSLES